MADISIASKVRTFLLRFDTEKNETRDTVRPCHLATAPTIGEGVGKPPSAPPNLHRLKQLPRQADDAVHQVGFDDVLAAVAFARLVARERSRPRARRAELLQTCVYS